MHCFICQDTCMLASGFFVLAVLSALLTISAAEKKACETGKAYPKSGAKADARLQPHSVSHSKLIQAIRTIVLIANCHSILCNTAYYCMCFFLSMTRIQTFQHELFLQMFAHFSRLALYFQTCCQYFFHGMWIFC